MSSTESKKYLYETDPVLMAVLGNRLNAIVGEMTNTLLRTARSAVLAVVRDFSCSIVTADNRLLAPGEGVPVHIFGSSLQTQSMCDTHKDIAPGDAFLHNDPYMGNTHSADHMYLVPVFVDGEHLFTACAKAHQADCGNSIPSTYHAYAKDVYEEGALVFPCVRVQKDYRDVDDIIRMCRRRIRVPEQWYGDYLATVGAARIGERRLVGLVERYGKDTIKQFIEDWFAYSERRMIEAIKELPAGKVTNTTTYDPMEPTLPNGLPIKVSVEVDPEEATIEVDLTENEDNKPFGLNESVACAISNAMCGVFNCIDSEVPHNAGSFARVNVKLREGCVTGIPEFPLSCSMATTNIGDRIVNSGIFFEARKSSSNVFRSRVASGFITYTYSVEADLIPILLPAPIPKLDFESIIKKNKKKLFYSKRNSDLVEAMMEFGALICKPQEPNCGVCPISKTCKFHKSNRHTKLTDRTRSKKKSYNIFCYLNKKKQIGLTKKNDLGFLREYSLPIIKKKSNKHKFKNWNFLCNYKNSISNKKLDINLYYKFSNKIPKDLNWHSIYNNKEFIPTFTKKIFRQVENLY